MDFSGFGLVIIRAMIGSSDRSDSKAPNTSLEPTADAVPIRMSLDSFDGAHLFGPLGVLVQALV